MHWNKQSGLGSQLMALLHDNVLQIWCRKLSLKLDGKFFHMQHVLETSYPHTITCLSMQNSLFGQWLQQIKETTLIDWINSEIISELGDPKASFSIVTIPRCKGGPYSFPWITPLTFNPYLTMLSVKQGDIKYHFLSL